MYDVNPMPRIVMLVNPVFSAWRRRSVPAIRQVFERAGIVVEQVEMGGNRSAINTARQAVREGVDAVMVCGGDGSVFDVLQGVAGSETPIGILPFGTGNVLAKNLGLPRNPLAAARALLKADPISVPLGRITCGAYASLPGAVAAPKSWYFAMSAGIGGHASMLLVAHRYKKHRTGRLAYFAAGVEVLATHSLQPIQMEVFRTDGSRATRVVSELIAVRVSHLNLWRPGGGLELPFLRLASVNGVSRLRLAQATVESLMFQTGRRDNKTNAHHAARYEDALRINAQTFPGLLHPPPIPLQADGEIIASVTASAPCTIEMSAVSAVFLSAKK